MILARNKLSRLERVNETKTARGSSLADMINETADTRAKETPRKVTAKAMPPAKPAEIKLEPAKVAPAKSPSVNSPPPPPPPQWWEEKLGWRSRGTPPPSFYDDGVRYETIHEYDPLERAEEEDYD